MYYPKIKVDAELEKKEQKQQCCHPFPLFVCYDINQKMPVPLQNVHYNLKVFKGMIIVEIQQNYSTKDYEQPIDLEYIFTIAENAAVTKMIVELGDVRVQGIVKEKEVRQGQEGIKKCKTMAYCDQIDESRRLREFNQDNQHQKNSLKLLLKVCLNTFFKVEVSPIINEYYIHLNQQQNLGPYDIRLQGYFEKYVTLRAMELKFEQYFTIVIDTGSKITFIKSPTHALLFQEEKKEIINTQLEDSIKKIVLQDTPNNFAPNKQSILFSTEDKNLPSATLSHINNGEMQQQKYCVTITFVPKFYELLLDDAYQHYLDYPYNKLKDNSRGGQMEGFRIEKAKQSLILFLKNLPDNCLFNIISFGNEFQLMWQESQIYNQMTLDQAICIVKNFKADMGGANILKVLQEVIYTNSYRQRKEQTLNVFLLTNGDTPLPILNLVKINNIAGTRIYTLGIGDGCSQYLIKQLAEVGNCKHQFVSDNGYINEKKIIDLLKDSITPYLQSFTVDCDIKDIFCIIPDPVIAIGFDYLTQLKYETKFLNYINELSLYQVLQVKHRRKGRVPYPQFGKIIFGTLDTVSR